MSLRKTLRLISPKWLRGIRRNCGGFNPDNSLFAGRLVEPDLLPGQWSKLVNALIFPNGVRKSTHPNRNANVITTVFESGAVDTLPGEITVMDMGASVGIDAAGNLEALQRFRKVHRYVLADLYTELLYDSGSQRIFDQDGVLLQQKTDRGFIALYFEFKYRIELLFHLFNVIRTREMRRRSANLAPDPEYTLLIPLVFPAAREKPEIETLRANVFQPLDNKYDLILCMNLLQKRYFPQADIDRGNQNLTLALNPGGVLITGVTDHYKVFGSDGSLIMHSRATST